MNTLFNLQQKLNVPKLQQNKFGGYAFRSCEDILQALKPLLAEEQATLVILDDLRLVGTSVFVEAHVTLTDKEGKSWKASASARHAEEQKGMMDSQLTGATSSYARKYALNGLFLIDDNKDADSTNDGTKSDKKAPEKKPLNQTPPTPIPTTSKKEWLNPGTPSWTSALNRMRKDGMKLDDVKKIFLISKANEDKLTKEANENTPLS